MASRPAHLSSPNAGPARPAKLHRFGEHGVLLALPISVALWVLIGKALF